MKISTSPECVNLNILSLIIILKLNIVFIVDKEATKIIEECK